MLLFPLSLVPCLDFIIVWAKGVPRDPHRNCSAHTVVSGFQPFPSRNAHTHQPAMPNKLRSSDQVILVSSWSGIGVGPGTVGNPTALDDPGTGILRQCTGKPFEEGLQM